MNDSCTRRDFLKMAGVGAVAVGFVSYVNKAGDVLKNTVITCSKCNATFVDGHAYEAGVVQGVYCPNCGVEIVRLVHDVDHQTTLSIPQKQIKRKDWVSTWNCAQVPFPNRKRVKSTQKPAFVLSDIRL